MGNGPGRRWRIVAIACPRHQLAFSVRRNHVHVHTAKCSVLRRIRRVVAQRVLAPQFLGDLVEGFLEFLF